MGRSKKPANKPQQQTITYALHDNCYINLTNKCTLRCTFCPKFNKQWDVKGYRLRLKNEPDINEVLEAVGDPLQYKEIVFCGLGEPTLRLDELIRIASALKSKGATIRLNTDGLANAVYKKDVTTMLSSCVDSLSVSLNAQNSDIYTEHCRPLINNAFNEVQNFILAAKNHIPDITVTAIDGLSGVDIQACENIATKLGVKFRRRVLDKVG